MFLKRFNGKLRPDQLLFLIAWSMFVVTITLQGTLWYDNIDGGAVTFLFRMVRYIAYLLCVLLIIDKYLQSKMIILSLLLLAAFALTAFGSTNKTMLLYSLFIIAAYELDSRFIIKISLFWQTAVVFGTVLLSQTGILEDYLFGVPVRLRHGLGFAWTSFAPIMFFYCMLQYIYLRREKIRWFEFIIMEAVNVALFLLTDTRMAFYVSTAFLACFCVINQIKRTRRTERKSKNNRWKWGLCAVPAIMAAGSILLHACYNESNGFYRALNTLFSKRLELGFSAIKEYGITWLGQKIEWIGYSVKPVSEKAYNYVDCSYLQLLLEFGILFLIITVAIYTVLIWRAVKERDNYLLLILCIVLLFAVTEPRLMNFAYNPFPVLLMSRLSRKEPEALQVKSAQNIRSVIFQ